MIAQAVIDELIDSMYWTCDRDNSEKLYQWKLIKQWPCLEKFVPFIVAFSNWIRKFRKTHGKSFVSVTWIIIDSGGIDEPKDEAVEILPRFMLYSKVMVAKQKLIMSWPVLCDVSFTSRSTFLISASYCLQTNSCCWYFFAFFPLFVSMSISVSSYLFKFLSSVFKYIANSLSIYDCSFHSNSTI